MTNVQYQTPAQNPISWADELVPTDFSIPIFYRGTGHVIEASLGGGIYFWAIMNNAMITTFGQSSGSFGDRTRVDIFTASSAVSVADLYTIINTQGATGKDVFALFMAGNDFVVGSDNSDFILAGYGSDTVTGGLGADHFELYGGTHTVTDLGLGGVDSFAVHDQANLTFEAAADWSATSETYNQGTATILTGGHIIDMRNAATADGNGFTVTSASESTAVVTMGSEGADILVGGSADDQLFGEGGDDVLSGGFGNDLIDGQSGVNTVSFASGAKAASVNLNLNVAQKTGYGFDTLVSIQNVIGSNANDKLVGNAADNLLEGGSGNDALTGNFGNDYLQGGFGKDTLNGGAGDDFLYGGAGKDKMQGGVGADTFYFTELTDSLVGAGRDVISGFNAAEGDVLDFHDMNSPHGFDYQGGTAFTGEAGELIYKNGLLSCDVDGNKVADFQISVVLTDPWHSIIT